MRRRPIKRIHYSSKFLEALAKVAKEAKEAFLAKEKLFLSDCFNSQLNTHKLHGKYKNYWPFSITSSWRIMITFMNDDEVGFINIGTHDIYR